MDTQPETYHLPPTDHAPNNALPVLIYRSVLPKPASESGTTEFLTSHQWRKDGTWGHVTYRHWHPNVHECYGVFSGHSRLLLGCGHADTHEVREGSGESMGLEIDVKTGDVVVLPAGTGHVCLESSKPEDEDGEYRYIGVYPENGPKWRSEYGKKPIDHERYRQEIAAVASPLQDPVYGKDGPLMTLWQVKQ